MNVKQAKIYFSLGKALAKKREWKEAIAAYRQAIERKQNFADAYHFLGDALVETGDQTEAINVYKKAVEINPELWEVYHKLGSLLPEIGELEEAIINYHKSIELKSDFCWSYNNLGDVLVKLEQWEEAVNAYSQAIELNPNFPWTYYKLGDVLVKLEDWEEAIGAYRKAIELQPDLVGVHEKLANTLNKQTRLASEEIIFSYRHAIEENPDRLDNYYKILEIIPNDYTTNLQLASTFFRTGELAQAIVFSKKAIELQPKNFKGYAQLGDILSQQQNWEQAINIYHQALQFIPDNWELILKLADVQEKQNDISGAIASYQKALQIESNLAIKEKLTLLMEVEKENQHLHLKTNEEKITIAPTENHVDLGLKFAKEGRLDEAADNYQKALQINQNSWLVYHDLGDIFRKQGKLNEAVDCYRQTLNINPNYFWSIYNLGKVFVAQKKLNDAVICYRRFCELQPNNNQVKEELEQLLLEINNQAIPTTVEVNNITIFVDDLQESWCNWKVTQKVKLLEHGKIIIQQDTSTPGIEKIITSVESDCFYFIEYELNTKLQQGNIFISVVDIDNNLQIISHEYLNQTGTQNVKGTSNFRTPFKTKKLTIRFLVDKPKIEEEVNFKFLKLVKIASSRKFNPLDYESSQLFKSQSVKTVACMASVGERESMLFDVINCLYPFVDKLCVYLNNYSNVPDFLQDPKIEYIRSQDCGDFGDAGKFYWVEDKSFDVMFTVDDDLLYPPNYVDKIINKLDEYNGNAILGCHGVFIKQPLIEYYNQQNRHTLRFSHALDLDRQVHVLGTGTVAFSLTKNTMKKKDFLFRNSADVWLALYAQSKSMPLISISRPRNWIVENSSELHIQTIYSESHTKTNSCFNSSAVQNHALRKYSPLTIKTIVHQGIARPKFIFAIKTWNRLDYLQKCIESFLTTRSLDFEWVVIIADDGSTDGTVGYLQSLTIPHELHVIYNHGVYACGQTNTIFDLSMLIGFDLAFHVDDDIFFIQSGWDKLYAEAVKSSGYEHLCYRNWQQYLNLKRKQSDPNFQLAEPTYDSSGKCESIVDVFSCDGSFFTITPNVINRVGYTDEKNFPIRGQWHIDYSARCARAGFNTEKHFFDAKNSNEYIELQANSENYRCSLPWNENYKKTKEPEELKRRNLVVKNSNRIYVSRKGRTFIEEKLNQKFTKRQINCVYNFTHINDVFEKVFVLNLDRRQDRLEKVLRQTKKLGIEFERYSAVDGKKEPNLSEYQEYSQQPLVNFPLQETFISTWKEFYLNPNISIISKVAFVENKNKAKAIASPGAWGYLKSYIAILTEAISKDYESILVFDDDVIFHNDFNQLFSQIYQQLPDNWMILQLGALQYDWGDDWISWQTKNLYLCNGSSVGSHAVAIHYSAYPILLNYCLLYNLPFDIGPLTAVQNQYKDRCFVFSPNLAIQDVSESDISSSEKQSQEAIKENNIYRWHLNDYSIYL
ncbi:MAG: tetratricopeptide repeat protein [Okeania sp. SIO2G4]|uniref:tetratricopeptide repeat protein n=1 Tax=unclassified Okeania TaxID=2634635 RepID=UPI0013BC6ABA|nr:MULTISPECIES: tetratricopeptide repeat protein [unclassified Okeania]NEP75193.1 tetratricopeptide repeat protein [Okeania sp. SIO2G5]NEP96243.1 tetratricopeptide repeat protein [Okeania sp. SIO2F5]NEQ93983.1 tetratricopeptide repeat protein [Okeania sp. SIO2G4]